MRAGKVISTFDLRQREVIEGCSSASCVLVGFIFEARLKRAEFAEKYTWEIAYAPR